MDLQMFCIEQAPRWVPSWDAILTDLGEPPPERIARALGVGRATVYRWNKAGKAPRMACLALFWLTRWGHSQIATQATNDAILAAQLVRALSAERDRLQHRLRLFDPRESGGYAESLVDRSAIEEPGAFHLLVLRQAQPRKPHATAAAALRLSAAPGTNSNPIEDAQPTDSAQPPPEPASTTAAWRGGKVSWERLPAASRASPGAAAPAPALTAAQVEPGRQAFAAMVCANRAKPRADIRKSPRSNITGKSDDIQHMHRRAYRGC